MTQPARGVSVSSVLSQGHPSGTKPRLIGNTVPKAAMRHRSYRQAAARILAALTLSFLNATACLAIDGGQPAGRSPLSRATVGIGTLVSGEGTIGLTRCSGVLIAPDLVLTAGHCVKDNPLASAVVLYDGAQPTRRAYRVAALAHHNAVADDLPSEYSGLLALSLDTAVLRLADPVRGRKSLRLGRGIQPKGLLLAGTGLSRQGVGFLKTTHLDPVLRTSTGLVIAVARGSQVCTGDSGGPVVSSGPGGPRVWGVASAVLTSHPPCGNIVVVAPAIPRM